MPVRTGSYTKRLSTCKLVRQDGSTHDFVWHDEGSGGPHDYCLPCRTEIDYRYQLAQLGKKWKRICEQRKSRERGVEKLRAAQARGAA